MPAHAHRTLACAHRALAVLLLLAAAVACGGDRRRDPPPDGSTGGVACGAARCAAGARCCDHCTGTCVPEASGAFCPDDADPGRACPAACRQTAECEAGQECAPPEDRPVVCGIPCMVERGCEAAADCAEGEACAELLGGCCQPSDPLSSACVPACAPTSCPEGQACDADGVCRHVPCDAGFACPVHQTCRPGEGGYGSHGCVRDACAADAECGGGVCVVGRCYATPGTCETPMAVP